MIETKVIESAELERKQREARTIEEAKRTNKVITYIDTDGCEVTCTPAGHAFYNADDWM
jgi:hypothetical protein